MTIAEAKEKVVRAGIQLLESGLIARTWGNVSHRISAEQFVITPSGRDYHSITPQEIVTVNIADCSYQGSIKPSSEKGVHAEVYKRFPEVNFVIHTHQHYASVISACEIDAMPVAQDFPYFHGEVICAAYALPSTKKLQRNVSMALTHCKGKALIMKHHGAVCFGVNDEEAFQVALELEMVSQRYITETYRQLSGSEQVDATAMSHFALNIPPDDSATHTPPMYDEEPLYSSMQSKWKTMKYIHWNTSPEAIAFSRSNITLKPLLDDFAQIVGTSMKVVENDPAQITIALKRASAVFVRNRGALCVGDTQEDAQAVSMVVEKNCRAYIGATLFGRVKSIHPVESWLMRFIYVKKYSKQAHAK